MRIGIDMDNTLSDTSKIVFEYADMYDKKYKEGKGIVNPLEYNFVGKYDWTEEDKIDLFKRYREEWVINAEPKKDAIDVIKKLKEEGNEIYIITGRQKGYFTDPYKITLDWLKKHNVLFDKVVVDTGLKGIVCKNNDVDILIDDSIIQCADVLNNGVKALLFDAFNNKDSDIKRVYNWKEIYELLRK
ncbi:MAG TPA: hypothetical protein PLC53_01615 [Bacilli bacterium]|nr:hypothetical protein [Bacilli bacterium]